MDFAPDLSLFYADFGKSAIVDGNTAAPVPGIFEAHHADALGMVSGTRPVFRAARSSPIVRGADVCIGGIHYTAKAGEPVGDDETIWPLELV